MDFHRRELSRRCRICGRKLSSVSMLVSKFANQLLVAFGVDIRADNPAVHPERMCGSCYTFTKRTAAQETSSGKPRETSIVPAEWCVCSGDSCKLCEKWHGEEKGGYRTSKMSAKKRGRPSADTSKLWKGTSSGATTASPTQPLQIDLAGNAEASLQLWWTETLALEPHRFVVPPADEFICPICKDVLDKPMDVPSPGCQHSCCMDCWEHWIGVSQTCPVCRDQVLVDQLQPSSRFFRSALSSLEIYCDHWSRGCSTVLKLCNLKQHAASCTFAAHEVVRGEQPRLHAAASIPDTTESATAQPMTLQDVIARGADERPLCEEEDKALGIMVSRLASVQETSVRLSIYTGGRRSHISYTPPATVGSSAASSKTLARRRQLLKAIEETVTGKGEADLTAQTAFALSRASQEERQALLFEAKASRHHVTAEDTAALALHLRLSNEQMKKLRLWTKQWNVQLASEAQFRTIGKEHLGGVDIGAEMVQSIYEQDDECIFKPVPFCWVRNISVLVTTHLDQLLEKGALTWHENKGVSLPKDELWLKFGGDKGGGSFKFCFQAVNRDRPNSADHTVVISCLMAEDSLANMHIGIYPFQTAVEELNGM